MLTAEQMEEAKRQLATAANGNGGGWGVAQQQPQPVSAFGMPQQQPQAAHGPQAVLVPIQLKANGCQLRIYLQFPGEMAASPETLMAAVSQLAESGMPLDFWREKQRGWGGGGGNGGGNGGGWGGGNGNGGNGGGGGWGGGRRGW